MADVLVRAEFDDGGATAGLSRLGSTMDRLERTGATRGLRQVETGLNMLAAQAVGVSGPLGRVAEGLLRFGAGSEIMLGAAAGIGLVVGAYKLAQAESEKLVRANEKLAASFEQTFGGKRVQQFKSLSALTDQLEQLRQTANALQDPTGRGFAESGGLGGIVMRLKADVFGAGSETERIQAETAVATALDHILTLNGQITAELKRQTAEHAKQVQLAATQAHLAWQAATLFRMEQSGLDIAQFMQDAARSDSAVTAFDRLRFGPDAIVRPLDTRFGRAPEAPPRPLDRRFGEGIGLPFRPSRIPGNGPTPEAIISASLGALGGIAGSARNGATDIFGSLLSGAGGIASLFKGLGPVGMGLTAVGGLVQILGGLFSHSKPAVVMIDGYSSTAITQQQQIMQLLAGFLGIKISLLSAGSATAGAGAYELGRRARLDGGMRLPPGAIG